MTIDNVREIINKNKNFLKEKYKVKSIKIFGSFARHEEAADSDIDILIGFYSSPDIFEFIELEGFLGNLLGVKVDLVTEQALKPLIKDKILEEAISI
ncbi:MAG: nucleotidyltransferase family protein [Candidatus Omnitrophica bacterium]|nr:nucleotidyltransferase family protein [Candidatus Omnitrophota bacterium]